MLVPYQRGGYPVFVGRAYQKGRAFGSIMSSVFRNLVVPSAKDIGQSLLRTGLKRASNVMRGVADGKNVRQAFLDEVPAPIKTIVGAPQTRKTSRAQQRRKVAVNTTRGLKRKTAGRGPPAKRAYKDIFS